MPRQQKEDKTNVKDEPKGWEFTDDDTEAWGSKFAIQDNPIAKAWSRARRSGHDFGPPVDADKELDNGDLVQHFMLGVRALCHNDDNQTTEFFDSRGLVLTESGL